MADVEVNATAPALADLLAIRPALKMHAQDGLCFEDIPLNAIADVHGTPVWVYGAGTIRQRYQGLVAAFSAQGLNPHIHYAVKANDHLAIISLLRKAGAGADIVSLGEFLRARAAGVTASDIVFSGVGKSPAEMAAALAGGVGQMNVESAEELDMLSAVASSAGLVAKVALRMNPDVDAGTNSKIATGRAGDKFGIPAEDIPALYARAAALTGIEPVGLALHIGSQILSPAPYAAAYGKAAEMVRGLRAAGLTVSVLDIGGGLGIAYQDQAGLAPDVFAAMVKRTLGDLGVQLLVEPGRYLVGSAGLLLASVILSKRTGAKNFIVVDAAMNDLIRPTLYNAWHGIMPVSPVDYVQPLAPADVVGPVCESGDFLAKDRPLPPLRPGARLAVLDAGAYGAVMSSPYNTRPRAATVLVDGAKIHLITPRQSVQDLWRDECIPADTP
jgi:diaminopimelate decarboxylase